MQIDLLPTVAILTAMNEEDKCGPIAVKRVIPDIAAAVECIVHASSNVNSSRETACRPPRSGSRRKSIHRSTWMPPSIIRFAFAALRLSMLPSQGGKPIDAQAKLHDVRHFLRS